MHHSPSASPQTAPTRVLFVSLWELGWKTWGSQLERYSEDFPGMEAVHLHVSRPRWMWALSRNLPRPIERPLLSSRRSWEWQMKRTVVGPMSAGNFDVVLVSSQILMPAFIEPCRRAGVRLAVALDVTGPAYKRDLLHRKIPASETWADERRIYKAVDLCVPMSSWIADSLHKDFHVATEQICVSPPSVPTANFPRVLPQKEAGQLPRILFCGYDWERKGGPRLVRWHQELWSQKAELHIVSRDGIVLKDLPNVFCHGTISYERLLNEMLPSSDIFCMPTYNDMSPFAVSEAQAAGLPTVSSRIGGLSDLVIEGKTGFLLPPDDEEGFKEAITRLIDDPALRTRMREAAYEHAEANLDAAKVIPRLFQRLVALRQHPQHSN